MICWKIQFLYILQFYLHWRILLATPHIHIHDSSLGIFHLLAGYLNIQSLKPSNQKHLILLTWVIPMFHLHSSLCTCTATVMSLPSSTSMMVTSLLLSPHIVPDISLPPMMVSLSCTQLSDSTSSSRVSSSNLNQELDAKHFLAPSSHLTKQVSCMTLTLWVEIRDPFPFFGHSAL